MWFENFSEYTITNFEQFMSNCLHEQDLINTIITFTISVDSYLVTCRQINVLAFLSSFVGSFWLNLGLVHCSWADAGKVCWRWSHWVHECSETENEATWAPEGGWTSVGKSTGSAVLAEGLFQSDVISYQQNCSGLNRNFSGICRSNVSLQSSIDLLVVALFLFLGSWAWTA